MSMDMDHYITQNEKDHTELGERIEHIVTHQASIAEDIAIIKSYLIGNGREGMLKKVDRLEEYINKQKGSIVSLYFILITIMLPISLLVARVYWGN